MTSRSLRASALVLGLFAVLGVGCSDSAVEGPQHDLKSAGVLPESRLPHGWNGVSPAPTGAVARDKSLEAGWYKRAKPGEKAPSYADRPSL